MKDKKYKDIESMTRDLSTYEYGFWNGNRVEQENFDDYHIMSTEDIDKYHCGTCWDMTNYIYKYTKAYMPYTVGCILYYIENPYASDGSHPTHSWPVIVYKRGIGHHVCEAAWKKFSGVHSFRNEKAMLDYYIKLWKENEEGREKDTYFVMRYEYFDPTGMDPETFMRTVYSKGKIVRQHGCDEYIEKIEQIVKGGLIEESAKMIDKKLTYAEIEKKIYFIADPVNLIENGVFEINGEQYRVRVETLVKREKEDGTPTIFFEKKEKPTHYGTMYKLPGGSVEPDRTLSEQAEAECNEEVLCKVKNLHYTGKYYIVKYDPKDIPAWHKEKLWPLGLKYVGAITFVFTAEYDGPYRKKVEDEDKDPLAKQGDWYPIWEFEELRSENHEGITLESLSAVTESVSPDEKDHIKILRSCLSDDDVEAGIDGFDVHEGKIHFDYCNPEEFHKKAIDKWMMLCNNRSKIYRFVAHGNEIVVTNKKTGELVTTESTEVVEESTKSGSNKGNIIPLDLSKYKEPGSRVICLNTHQINIANQELGLLKLGAIHALIKSNPLVLGGWLTWIGFEVFNLKDQLFALDFVACENTEEFFCNDLDGYPVIATNDGEVMECLDGAPSRMNVFQKMALPVGNYVILSHNNGECYSLYAHIRPGSVRVKTGDVVKRGQLLGLVGHSGNSDAEQSHLHFEFFTGSILGEMPKKPTGFDPYYRSKEFSVWDITSKEFVDKIMKYDMVKDSSGTLSDGCFLTPPSLSQREKNASAWDEFCQDYDTPEKVLDFLRKRGAHWPTKEELEKRNLPTKRPNGKPFTWPEEMITAKKPMALCYDYAVFFHFYFQKRNVKNHVVAMGWWDADKEQMITGHAICVFMRDNQWYIVDYHEKRKGIRRKMDMIIGPSKDIDNLVEAYVVSMKLVLSKAFPKVKRITHYYLIQSEEEMARYYDSERGSDTSQEEIVTKDFYRFFRPVLGKIFKNNGVPSAMALPFIPLWTLLDAKDKIEELFEGFDVRPDVIEGLNHIALEATEKQPEIPAEVEEPKAIEKPFGTDGIVSTVLKILGDKVDQKEFASLKTGKKFMYTRCRVMQKFIPLVILLAYCEGLTTVMRKAEVQFQFSDTRPRLTPTEATRKGLIPFADGYLIYNKFPLHISLLMNGLSVMNTKSIDYADMDTKDVYADLFDTLFGARMLANALDNFYDLMIDPVTKEILDDLNYPTDFVGLLLVGNKLLADNNYIHELDMRNWRIRNNEQVYAHAYKKIADAYSKYRSTADNKNPAKISVPQDSVIKSIMTSQIVEDVSELSPQVEMKKSHVISDKGPSGTNLEESYTMERRCFHPSMLGVIGMSTSPDGNVGIQRELTIEPNVYNARGYVKAEGDRNESECNLFTMAELLSPGGAVQDDQIRSAMSSKQSSHIVPVEEASPVLVSNGSEKVIPYHLSNDFSVVAKDDGEVVERDEKTGVIVVKYKHLQGDDALQVINMNTKVVKNGAGGFFLTNKMNCDNLKKGTKFKKNDVLAYNTRFFSSSKDQGVRFNIGTLAKIACVASYANFEDADMVTDKLSKKLGTQICMEETAIIGKNGNVDYIVKKGQEVGVNDPLIIYDQSSDDASFNKMLAHIGKDLKEEITGMGKVPVKSKYAGVIEDIKIYATVDTKEMSPSLRKIVEGYYSEIRARDAVIKKHYKGANPNGFAFMERAEKIEPTQDGKIMGIKVGEGVLIRFFIKYQDNLSIGDKLVHFAAVKCVNGEMVPKGLEPYSLDHPEEEISSTFAPAAILSRMVPSIKYVARNSSVS